MGTVFLVELWIDEFDSMGNGLTYLSRYEVKTLTGIVPQTDAVICKCKYELLRAKHFYHHEYPDHCLFSFKYSNHCIALLPVFRVLPMPAEWSRYSGSDLGPVSLQSIITRPQYQCVTGGDQADGSESQDVWGIARRIVLGLITIHNLHNLH